MTADAPERDYEVGYGKTPEHTRFKPGQSGNPRGRSKGSKNGRVLMAEELNQAVTFMENGKRIKTSKLGLIIKRATNEAAAKGDVRSLLALMKQFGLGGVDGNEEKRTEPLDSLDDAETRESILRRIRREKP